ncbi:kinase-like domain-containing protein [Rhizophagus clarus]|uniref:Kinase-like domain-containing protein n=1 Tax=Rhizophagus clarus TaxID=94130 RepID=A0A8H3KR09_9GLOM|nr:kinase-like domain-containing protein [Rhizophagus clarus]
MVEHSENQRKWLQAAIAAGHIISIPFATFDQAEIVARGAFGEVSRAYWKSAEKTVALKSLYNNPVMGTESSFEEFVKELKLIRSVDFHDNVIRFYGVSEDPTTRRYFMVLQYANGGNLRDFLNKNHEFLNWETRIKMASQIASGLKCIHERNIVHRDLHSKNILVHDGKMMITDFGLSKSLDNNEHSVVGGMVGYIEPQCFIDSTYKRDKASDIYSLGVLLWEISSGKPPFNNMAILDVAREVVQGRREAPIRGSPPAYVAIYQMAWDGDSKKRPTINKIREDLELLQSNCDIEHLSLVGLSINSQGKDNHFVSSPVSEFGSNNNFAANFGAQNSNVQQQSTIPFGVAESMNPNKKSTLRNNYIHPNNNNTGQLMSPPNSNEISIKQDVSNSVANPHNQNPTIVNIPFGVASSMNPHRSNTASNLRTNYLSTNNTAPIPSLNSQNQTTLLFNVANNNGNSNYGSQSNSIPIPQSQISQVSEQNYPNISTADQVEQKQKFSHINNELPSNQFPQNFTQNSAGFQRNNTISCAPRNDRIQESHAPRPFQQQQRPFQPQLYQHQPRPYQPPQSQPYQQSQPQPYQQRPPQPQSYQHPPPRPQPYQQSPPYQQSQPQPYQQRPPQPQSYQQPPQTQSYQQQPPQTQPYQQQPPQTQPYQQQPPQTQPYPPQPQSYQQQPLQPRPYQPPQQQPYQQQPYQQQLPQPRPQNYNNMQFSPMTQRQNQVFQHHSNQYPGIQNQPGLQRNNTMQQQPYTPQQNFPGQNQKNNTYIPNQPPSQPFNNSYPHHSSQRPMIQYPSQNPCECTCADIMTKYVKQFQNIRGYEKPGECHAGYHAGMGDVVGLRWHLHHDGRVDGNYKFIDMSDKLVLIAARYCGKKNLNIMFQCLKEYGASFEVITKKKGQTAFHLLSFNKVLSRKRTSKLDKYHRVFFQAIKFLKEVKCNINAKDEDGMTVLSYFLEEKFNHQELTPIIQALLDNGVDPNIPVYIKDWGGFDAKTALLQAVRNKWPTTVLESIVKHGVDVKAINDKGMNALAIATQAKDLFTMTWMLDNISNISDSDSIKIAKKFTGNFTKEVQLLNKKRNKVILSNDLSSFSSTNSSTSNNSNTSKKK